LSQLSRASRLEERSIQPASAARALGGSAKAIRNAGRTRPWGARQVMDILVRRGFHGDDQEPPPDCTCLSSACNDKEESEEGLSVVGRVSEPVRLSGRVRKHIPRCASDVVGADKLVLLRWPLGRLGLLLLEECLDGFLQGLLADVLVADYPFVVEN